MRLSQEVVALLRMLVQDGAAATGAGPEAPKVIFEFNLVSRLGSGALQLTKTGARALFQAECIEALEQSRDGGQPPMVDDVERWLTSSGFLHPGNKTMTARGALWLASLSPSPAEALVAELHSAAQPAASRRSSAA